MIRTLTGILSAAALLATGVHPQSLCPDWTDPHGVLVDLAPTDNLVAAVENAIAGTTLLLASGTYKLTSTLRFNRPGVTLRSKSGNREDVILDGNKGGIPLDPSAFLNEVIAVSASRVVIADLTIRYARHHDIHAYAGPAGTVNHLLFRNLHVYDAGEQLIKVNSDGKTPPSWVDSSVVECSLIEFKDNTVMEPQGEGFYTGGIDIHGGMGWTIRGNHFRNIQRGGKTMEHAVHMWSKSRDAIIERNRFEDVYRAIGLGMKTAATTLERKYADGKGDAPYFDFLGGIVRNNVVSNRTGIHLESGIELMNVLNVEVYHNTVVSADKPFTSIEYRWPNTSVVLKNNLASHNISARDGAKAEVGGNLENAPAVLFKDRFAGDFRLAGTAAAAVDCGVPLPEGKAPQDFDGAARDGKPDIGAYEAGAGAGLSGPLHAGRNPRTGKAQPHRSRWILDWDGSHFFPDGSSAFP
jgi:hypothetical protein